MRWEGEGLPKNTAGCELQKATIRNSQFGNTFMYFAFLFFVCRVVCHDVWERTYAASSSSWVFWPTPQPVGAGARLSSDRRGARPQSCTPQQQQQQQSQQQSQHPRLAGSTACPNPSRLAAVWWHSCAV